MDKPFSFVQRSTYVLLFVIAFFFILIIARDFLVPLAFGFLLSSLLFPVCRFLCHKGLPRGAAIFLSVMIMVVVFGGITLLFVSQIAELAADFQDIRSKAMENINDVYLYIENHFGLAVDWQKHWVKSRVDSLFTSGSEFFNNLLNGAAGTIFKVLMMPVYVFYILYYHDRFRQFILRSTPENHKVTANKILKEISWVSQRFFGGAFIVVMILVVTNSLGLYLIGLRYPILFGVISAVLNFIPYFGTWIGAFFPFMFALLTGDSINLALSVLIFFAFIQFTENNILTPHITGGYVRLNPFFTIIGLVAGGMVWGIAGMLLVIPFMASLKIILENIGSTRNLAFLIGRSEQETVGKIRSKIRAFFQLKRKPSP